MEEKGEFMYLSGVINMAIHRPIAYS